MDYNVRYNIDINGAQASKNISDFQSTIQRTIPPIITSLETLRKEIGKVNAAFVSLNRITGTRPKKIKFSIDNGIKKELKDLQSHINTIKGKTVTINTKVNQTTNTTTGSTTSIPGRKNRNYVPKNGNNRAARGFGSGAKGLFGAADVMYAAGFPFPNMIGAAAIGMGTMSIVKDAAEYENIMTTVQSILKATDKDITTFDQRFSDMSKNIRKVGVDTKFTTTEVAGAAKYLGMAGLNIEDINNSIKPIANLAIIGDAPLDRMADIVTNIQTAYGLDSSKMPQIADILTSVTTSTNTNVLEMGEAMKFAAPMMSMAKISFNEATAAIGALGNAGLKGTVAGTALRAMMTRLLNPTKKGTEVLKKYNIQLYELDKATGKTKLRSLFDIFSQLKSNDASVQDLTKLFDKIGGNAANNVFAELMKLPELIQNSIYSGGLADNIASKKQDTIKGKWDKVTSQFTETGMTVFEAYNPVIKEGLDDLVLLLKQPGTAQMFKDVATGLVALTKALVGVSTRVSENWNWLEYLVIGGVLFKKISKIVAAITPMAKGLFNTARGASALTTAIGGAGGVGSAIGGGLLAAIGGIPAIVTAAVTALASLGIGVYGAGKTTQAVSESIKKEYENLLPVFKDKDDDSSDNGNNNAKKALSGTKYYDFLGYDLGTKNMMFNGESSVYPQYIRAMSERGDLEGSKIANQYLMASIGMEDLGKDKIKSVYIDLIDDMENQKKSYKYNFGPYINLTDEERSRGVTILDSVNQLNADTESKTKQFTEAVNKSIDIGLGSLKEIMDLQLKIASGLPVSSNEAIDFIKNFTGYDLSQKSLGYHIIAPSGDIVYNDKEAATNTSKSAMTALRNSGVKSWCLNPLISALGDIKDLFDMSELRSTKDIRIEGDASGAENGGNGNGGNSAYSGVGKTSGTQPKIITINIQSLIGSINVNSTNEEDMETFKEKVTQVMIDAVKDFEISYS